ncbi:MAG: dienelactone hydrolase family protein [Alphaproteobacteria bacterium]
MSCGFPCVNILHSGGRHGFFNPIRETAYHPEATERAYLDLLRFLREHL